ncbi:MAG: hypothetical protein J0I40_05740 [Cellulomonas sp.]|uniref:hypothetical protein n=1 Tax=Cellulomonas sp. 73-92 TaxID=1895740 RepID=UPI00092C0B5E|nr:hypothetical protein [Cellulomonas sp. 73-92]MBN9374885.1 hypothetical protein [Cellulomonas sp.]OJV75966.1 MAG: hypothetical protein BGO37_06945 [Cellulomonas sp. 73-92]
MSVLVEADVVDGELLDASQGLGVEEDEQREHRVGQLHAVAVVDLADERDAVLLSQEGDGPLEVGRELESRHAPGVHRPA